MRTNINLSAYSSFPSCAWECPLERSCASQAGASAGGRTCCCLTRRHSLHAKQSFAQEAFPSAAWERGGCRQALWLASSFVRVFELAEKVGRGDRGNWRTGEIFCVARDDESGSGGFGHGRDDRIFKIRERKPPRLLPACGFEIADLEVAQHAIHRRLGIRFRGVFADEIVERGEAVRGTNTGQRPSRHETQHLSRCGVVRLAHLEDIQQHIDVHRDRHACFFSKWSRYACSPSASGAMIPLAAVTSGWGGLCKCSRRFRACRARNASAELPCARMYARRKSKSSSGNGMVMEDMTWKCHARARLSNLRSRWQSEIGGSAAGQFGRITINGSAALAGTLNLSAVNGFNPGLGSSFNVMTYASHTGQFDTVNGSLGHGKQFTVTYGASGLTVNTVAASPRGIVTRISRSSDLTVIILPEASGCVPAWE